MEEPLKKNNYSLRIEIEKSKEKGIEPEKIKWGDIIFARIIDKRDIANYVNKLLGGVKEKESIFLPAVVEKIEKRGHYFSLAVRFAPGIIGKAKINESEKIKYLVNSRKNSGLKKKIFG